MCRFVCLTCVWLVACQEPVAGGSRTPSSTPSQRFVENCSGEATYLDVPGHCGACDIVCDELAGELCLRTTETSDYECSALTMDVCASLGAQQGDICVTGDPRFTCEPSSFGGLTCKFEDTGGSCAQAALTFCQDRECGFDGCEGKCGDCIGGKICDTDHPDAAIKANAQGVCVTAPATSGGTSAGSGGTSAGSGGTSAGSGGSGGAACGECGELLTCFGCPPGSYCGGRNPSDLSSSTCTDCPATMDCDPDAYCGGIMDPSCLCSGCIRTDVPENESCYLNGQSYNTYVGNDCTQHTCIDNSWVTGGVCSE